MLIIKSMVIILFFLFLIMFVHVAGGKQLDSLRGIHHRQVRQLGGNLIQERLSPGAIDQQCIRSGQGDHILRRKLKIMETAGLGLSQASTATPSIPSVRFRAAI